MEAMPPAIASSGDCCKQMAEKLEKSEAGRKKLRTAIAMLKEKLEAADKLMAENATLREDLERERKERENAESSRLALEQDGNSLKDILAAAVTRIDKLEASQAKEMHFLRSEVKLALESARAAGKATEAFQGACQSLESNLISKLNNACSQFSKAGQNTNLQNGLKAVQATVSTVQREVSSLFSRAAALEKHHSLWDQQLHQLHLQQAQQTQPAKPTSNAQKPLSKTPAAAPERLASIPSGDAATHAKERFPSTPKGGIEVIPGIGDILNRPTQRLTKPAPRKPGAAGDQRKASKPNNNRLPVVEPVKDVSSDVTVHNECSTGGAARGGGEPAHLLSSITRLFEKEKRAHSKIEVKLAELEKMLGGLPSAPASHRKGKRKALSSTPETSRQKRARKSGGAGEATKKLQQNGGGEPDLFGDSDAEEVPAPNDNQVGSQVGHQVGHREGSQEPQAPSAQQPGENEPGFSENAQVSFALEEGELVISDEHLEAATFSAAAVAVKSCFFYEERRLKPPEAWKLELKEGLLRRPLVLMLASSLITVMNTPHSLVHQIAAFVFNVLDAAAFDSLLKHLSSFLISGKVQYLVRDSLRSGEATEGQITAASKLLAALCEASGYCRLLRSMTYRILRWCQLDNLLLSSILASLSSVSKRLLSEDSSSIMSRAIRSVTFELIAELENTSGELESLRGQVSAHETVEAIVDSALEHLVHPSETPGLELAREMSVEDMKTPDTEALSWHLRFHESAEALELVAFQMGWEWTYNELIVGKLWSLVAPGATQLTLAGVAYLLGSLGRQGVCDNLPGVDELRQRLAVILREAVPEQTMTLSTRLAAARSLLELSTSDKRAPRWGDDELQAEDVQVHQPEYVKTLQEWFHSLDAEEQKVVPACLKQRIFVR